MKKGSSSPYAERERAQLVVAIGEGKAGRDLKAKFEAAAEASGETLSSWARKVLAEAAGAETELPLSDRVRRLEGLVSRLLDPRED